MTVENLVTNNVYKFLDHSQQSKHNFPIQYIMQDEMPNLLVVKIMICLLLHVIKVIVATVLEKQTTKRLLMHVVDSLVLHR